MIISLQKLTGNLRIYGAVTLLFLIFSPSCFAIKAVRFPSPIRVGDTLPLPLTGNLRILAYMPSLSNDCEYASMLTQGFYYYFIKGLAFEQKPMGKKIDIQLIVSAGTQPSYIDNNGTQLQPDTSGKDDRLSIKMPRSVLQRYPFATTIYEPAITSGMEVVFDSTGRKFKWDNIKIPTTPNDATTLLLLDENNRVVYIDTAYRAQGEHLKPLESRIMDLEGLTNPVAPTPIQDSLKIGDRAPDFDLGNGKKLSDLRGKPVLISFYPAAFSGVFSPRMLLATAISCSVQIRYLDFPKTSLLPRNYQLLISSSTSGLLDAWKLALKTYSIDYVNDLSYDISKKYGSFHEDDATRTKTYNTYGYNNRVSFIIDRKGRIAYIDWAFSDGDEVTLHQKLDELSR